MDVFGSHYSAYRTVFDSTNICWVAPCEVRQLFARHCNVKTEVLSEEMYFGSQNAGHEGVGELPSHLDAPTDISTLPSTGGLGFSDLYLGNQSGENRNVGRKLTKKDNMIKGNVLVYFKIISRGAWVA